MFICADCHDKYKWDCTGHAYTYQKIKCMACEKTRECFHCLHFHKDDLTDLAESETDDNYELLREGLDRLAGKL